jgi:phosphoglycerate dehydrogenase-like enzyme
MKVVVADANLVPHRERLEAALPPGSTVVWGRTSADALRDADVFVGGRFTAEMAGAAEKLRLVHAAGAGTEKIAFDALAPDVLVANTFHHEQSIAEYVLAAAVLLRRGFLGQDWALREGIWATSVYNSSIPQPKSLQGTRVGFVGFGHIGRRSWQLFRAFECVGAAVTGGGNVNAAAEGLSWAAGVGSLDRLMADSEVVVVSAPLTERTVGMIGARQLDALGPDGVLINVGRGPLVAERALYEALSGRAIAGAAVDVWYRYPDGCDQAAPSELPFDKLPNVLMTPHSSGVTSNTFNGRTDDIAANIGRLQRGEPLRNLVSGRNPRH